MNLLERYRYDLWRMSDRCTVCGAPPGKRCRDNGKTVDWIHPGRGRDTFPCPACKEPALYSRPTDRYFHRDGSDNQKCWIKITRGEVR